MPDYTFYIISNAVLSFNGTTGDFDFSAVYDHTVHRYRVEVSDDDNTMDTTGDGNQTASIYDMDGNLVDSGLIEVPAYAEIAMPGGGSEYLDRIEIDGVHYGYLPSATLTPGESYPVTDSSSTSLDHSYFEANSVPCFAPDSLISTRKGEVPVQWIKPGDAVLTLDHGYQPVSWVGRWRVPWNRLYRDQSHWPVTIPPMAETSERALTVSASHRMLLRGPWMELHTGSNEVLCRSGLMQQRQRPAAGQSLIWHHILLPQHEIIRANGQWTESLFAGGLVFADLPIAVQADARTKCGDGHRFPARPTLRRHEAEAYFAQTRAQTGRRVA